MRKLSRTFLTGLAAILPAAVTLALLWWLGRAAETVLGGLLRVVLPELLYVPGMGILTGIVLIFVVGLLLQAYAMRWLFDWMDSLMQRIPVVKTIHGAVRDVTNLFSGDLKQRFGQTVLVQLPGTDFKLIGLVTRKDFEGLPDNLGDASTLAVYLPMSYQMGGYTLMLPRERVEPLDLSLEDALRYTLTAGVSAHKGD